MNLLCSSPELPLLDHAMNHPIKEHIGEVIELFCKNPIGHRLACTMDTRYGQYSVIIKKGGIGDRKKTGGFSKRRE